jgi:hypothetical protein
MMLVQQLIIKSLKEEDSRAERSMEALRHLHHQRRLHHSRRHQLTQLTYLTSPLPMVF